jgi:TPR repeat protein
MKKILLIFSVVSFGVLAASAQLAENTQRAIKAFENGKWEEGFRLSKDADLNDKSIQFYLGVMYANGFGVAKDESEAVKWYRKAAEQGIAQAQFNLGKCYDNGDGVEKDAREAIKWHRKAAEQGYAAAQCNLGLMYDNGRGVKQDESEAVKWYRKAAAQGDEDAKEALKRLGY